MKIRINNKGFTIAELFLAMAILVFALCGILATYVACFDSMTTSRNVNLATAAAQGVMESMRTAPFTSIVDTTITCDLVNRFKDCTFSVNNLPSSQGKVYIDETDPEFLIATIRVSWVQGNKRIGQVNGADVLSSPVELVTGVANR